MSASVDPIPPCACLRAVLGEDKDTLSDTMFTFIRINEDMNKEVRLSLKYLRLIVTPYEIKAMEED